MNSSITNPVTKQIDEMNRNSHFNAKSTDTEYGKRRSIMKIVVTDGYALNPGDLSWEALKELGETVIYDRTPSEQLAERLQDADIAVINKSEITKDVLDHCPKLKAVAVTATGYNVVDIEAAKERGIAVMNVPTYGTQTVAQFTVGLLLDVCARFEHHDQAVKEGRWTAGPDFCFWDNPIVELAGKTAGIIGLGRIGQATAGILKAMGMHVIAYNRSQCDSGRAVASYVDMDTLLETSDVIILHCPLTPETGKLINRETISRMKDGVILINTSRGGLVEEQDLTDALNSGKVYAAAADVVSTEPIRADNPLLGAKNCLITPHIAWASFEARGRIMDTTVQNIKSFLEGSPIHVVNS